MDQDIILTVDYHDENCVVRRLDECTGEERVMKIASSAQTIGAVVQQALVEATPRGGRVRWVQESVTGWARVQAVLDPRVDFMLVNVLQMPLPPKARRRKTDKIDTERMQRAYLTGELPLAHAPSGWWREVRRLVAWRENLVARQTALRNWINRYLAHETWVERTGLWSARGRRRLEALRLPATDRLIIDGKLAELDRLGQQLAQAEAALYEVYQNCAEAQRLDAIRGIGVIAAVSIVARIGPVQRFGNAERLIAFAGLAPGVRQSDETRRSGRIGAGGTDVHLRHYLIEATVWARQIPRYRQTYERVQQRRGKKIGRLVVARLLLRSIYKILRDGVAFQATPASR